jgi:multiple sugar transport system permease protein/N,N'-diacetylchitobiose transport system permease protein
LTSPTETPRAVRETLRRRRPRKTQALLAAALLLPSLLVVFGVVLYPLLRTVYTSFHDVESALPAPSPWVGLRNYSTIFADSEFWSSLWRTAYFTFLTTACEIALGIALGVLLNARFRGRAFVRAVVIIPWAVPTVVSGALWRWIYNGDYGPLNSLLVQLHVIHNYHQWLGTPWMALNMVAIEDIWKFTPFVALFILAGLGTIPNDLYEAATVDGASAWKRFWSITLPLLTPVILVTLVLRTIDGFRLFDVVYVMTHGGPANGTETLAFYTYVKAFSDQSFGLGSAIAIVITLIILVVTIAYTRILRAQELR